MRPRYPRVDNLLTFGRGSDTDEVPGWASQEDLAFLEHFPENPAPEDWQELLFFGGGVNGKFTVLKFLFGL